MEQDKIAHLTVPYLQGKRVLDLGCGQRTVWPSLIGVDNYGTFGQHTTGIKADIRDLGMFADNSVDACFSSHALEDFPADETVAILTEWARVIKIGGHLVLYVPSANLYPKVGEPGANPHHQRDIYPGDIEAALKQIEGCGWELLESEERGEDDEYSIYVVARKTESGWTENVWQRNPGGQKRALVIRYGGIGDMIMMASVLPQLKAQGFFVTVNCKTDTDVVVRHDPHIDEFIVQERDFVPNHELGPYWAALGKRYDKVVNLCESIEGSLLALGERLQSGYPVECRRKMFGSVNYVERAHDIAGVPFVPNPKFYPTEEEVVWAKAARSKIYAPVVFWGINGSSPHKVWPWIDTVVAWLLRQTPAHVFLITDTGIGKILQDAILTKLGEADVDMSRVHGMSGKWPLRTTLAAAQFADVVIGPETGLLNAVSMESVPKVIYLSHSSHENLTRDWVHTTVLTPTAKSAACHPCHLLHHTWQFCHQDEETAAALCASGISPERVFAAIATSLGAKRAAA
jgi:ADP-heptose:LPS heptosyltransferase/predicted SAM-dependent methyltransferase